jgi:histidine triad (HIT) family protein
MSSLFTRIIQGQIPGEFVLRGELWVAILDINPSAPGHCLLIPVAEAQHLHELPAATLAGLGPALARLTAAVRRATGCPALNVVVNDGPAAGQEVPHAHLHIIPRFPDDGRRAGLFGGKRAEAAALAEMGARLRAALAES